MRSLLLLAAAAAAAKSISTAARRALLHQEDDAHDLDELKKEDPNSYAIVQALLAKQNMGLLNVRHPSSLQPSPQASELAAAASASGARNWLSWKPPGDDSVEAAAGMTEGMVMTEGGPAAVRGRLSTAPSAKHSTTKHFNVDEPVGPPSPVDRVPSWFHADAADNVSTATNKAAADDTKTPPNAYLASLTGLVTKAVPPQASAAKKKGSFEGGRNRYMDFLS